MKLHFLDSMASVYTASNTKHDTFQYQNMIRGTSSKEKHTLGTIFSK